MVTGTIVEHERRREPVTLRWVCSCGWRSSGEHGDTWDRIEVEMHRAEAYREQLEAMAREQVGTGHESPT
jgi:hypothetical protein